jgi:hypothetical protein
MVIVALTVVVMWFLWMNVVCNKKNSKSDFVPMTYYVTPYVSHYSNKLDQRKAQNESF